MKARTAPARDSARPAPGAAVQTPAEERLTFLIHRVNARIAQTANRIFRTYDIESFSARILVLLLEHGEMRVGELVEALCLPQPTLSHQLQRLERRALILRRRLREDNRSVAVGLTDRGRVVARECEALSTGVHRFMIEGLDTADVARLKSMLATMSDRLLAYGPDAETPAPEADDKRGRDG